MISCVLAAFSRSAIKGLYSGELYPEFGLLEAGKLEHDQQARLPVSLLRVHPAELFPRTF
jgi:hypothetical protein